MTVFEKMLSDEYKDSFTAKIDNKLGLEEEYRQWLFSYIKGDEIDEDIRRLINGDFYFQPPIQHMVRKSHSEKRRKVYSFRGNEKLLLKYMAYVLMDFDDLHVDSLCSFRKDNRTRDFFRFIRKNDPHRRLYVMQADIHDFGGSIDQDICLDIADGYFKDDQKVMDFLR